MMNFTQVACEQMRERQSARGLHFAERKAGVQVFHVGQVDQHFARETAEFAQVGADDLQLEGAGAADVEARDCG
jgi:hypothetical protein